MRLHAMRGSSLAVLACVLAGSLALSACATTGGDEPAADGSSDEALATFLAETWRARDDRYSELRAQSTTDLRKIEMFAMGG